MDKKTKNWLGKKIKRKYPKLLIKKFKEIEKNVESKVNAKANITSGYCAKFSIRFEYINQYDSHLSFEVFEYKYRYIIRFHFYSSSDFLYYGMPYYFIDICSEEEMIEMIQNFYKLSVKDFAAYLEKNFREKSGGEKTVNWWYSKSTLN